MDEIKILVINLRLWHYFLEADAPFPPPPPPHTHTHPPHIQIRTHVTTGFIPYVTTLHRVGGGNCKESVKRLLLQVVMTTALPFQGTQL